MPRVVSGKARGTILDTPKGLNTRPTADKVKEAVFSILSNNLASSNFLDLFSGSGQMGIEALSRGSNEAFFIEQGREGVLCIQKNLVKTHLDAKAKVIMSDIKSGIQKIDIGKKFDIVYMDPPYDTAISYFSTCATLLNERKLLSENAIVVLEHRANDIPSEFVTNLKLKKSCKYGSVMVSFYGIVEN